MKTPNASHLEGYFHAHDLIIKRLSNHADCKTARGLITKWRTTDATLLEVKHGDIVIRRKVERPNIWHVIAGLALGLSVLAFFS